MGPYEQAQRPPRCPGGPLPSADNGITIREWTLHCVVSAVYCVRWGQRNSRKGGKTAHDFPLPFTHWRSQDYTKWNNISNSQKISIEPDVGFEWLLPQNQQLFAFSEAVTHNHHQSGSRCWHRHGQQSHTGLGGDPFAGSKERTLAIMTNYRGSWCELSWLLAQSIVAAATKRKWAHSHPTTFM